jgi:hypothetical protein
VAEDPADYRTVKQKALELLSAGDAHGAFSEFRWQLEYPGKVEPRNFADALTTLAQISAKITGPDWAAHVHRAARRPNDVQALFECGYQLIERSLHEIAATVLMRAHKLDPDAEGVLSELSIALEGPGLNAEACRVLRDAPNVLRESSTCRYLLAFNTLMTADIEGARREIDLVRVASGDENAAIMVGNLREMLARADAIRDVTPLDENDVRGWHAVVTGSLLLHVSPYGFESMRGRYAFVQDSESRVLEGINRLAAALDAWGKRPPRVLMLSGRESETLAVAAAEVLGLGVERFPLHKHVEGLIVAYDLASQPMEVLDVLVQHRTERLLWSHAAQWTTEGPFASDATTYLYQINHTPWQAGRLRVNPDTQTQEETPEVEGSPRELADAVLNAGCDLESMSDLDALTRLAGAMRRLTPDHPAAFGAFRQQGPRLRQRTDSPVKSARFL